MANALVELFRAATRNRFSAWVSADKGRATRPKMVVPAHMVWNSAEGPAQRYIDANGKRRYRRWAGPTGGKWPRKQSAASTNPKE